MHVIGPIDEMARNAGAVSELPEAVRVGTGSRAHDYDDIAFLEKLFYGVLAILGGVADVFLARCGERREAAPKGRHNLRRIVHRQGCLRDEREIRGIPRDETLDIRDALDEIDVAAEGGIEPPHGSFDFRVAS